MQTAGPMQKPIEGATILLVGPTMSPIPTMLLARRQLRVLWATSLAMTLLKLTSPGVPEPEEPWNSRR